MMLDKLIHVFLMVFLSLSSVAMAENRDYCDALLGMWRGDVNKGLCDAEAFIWKRGDKNHLFLRIFGKYCDYYYNDMTFDADFTCNMGRFYFYDRRFGVGQGNILANQLTITNEIFSISLNKL